ncbi:hypothetical protein J3F83DRAFT_413655 [Trichoderma novae-zelandiae]
MSIDITYLKYNLDSPLGCHEDIAEDRWENRKRQKRKQKGRGEKRRREREREREGKKGNHQNRSAMLRKRGRRGAREREKCDKESIASVMQQAAAEGSQARALCRDDCRRLHAKASRGRTRLDHRLAGPFLMPASVDRQA